jgi:N-acetyl-anhydromuramoyl-L-alanine amidase
MRRAQPASSVLSVDADGWVRGASRLDSPNRDARPPGAAIELLLIHGISLPPGRFDTGHVEKLFANCLSFDEDPYFDGLRGLRVSAHFLIARNGKLTQFVSCLERAWHAGASSFEGRTACNDFSLGVELEGTDELAYADAQYTVLGRLTRALFAAYPLRAIRGHSDVAPQRKTDPGPGFDWIRFARELRAHRSAFAPERLA